MGFFSSLLKGLGTVVGAVVNPGAAIAGLFGSKTATPSVPTATALVAPGAAARQVVQVGVTGTSVPLASGAGKAIGPGVSKGGSAFVGGVLQPRVVTGGNGKIAKRTIVQSINLDTGQVVLETVLEGAPFLMNKAVRELARTTKKLKKAVKKIPTRTVEQSLSKRLTDKVLRTTIDNVGDHHHHNGS